MLYRQDWDKVQQRYAAWLAGENDRRIVQVKAPKGPQTHGHTGWNFVHDMASTRSGPSRPSSCYCQQTHFAGDAIPNLFVNLGPGSPAAYLGCPVQVMPDTVWFHDAGMSWEQILATRLDADREVVEVHARHLPHGGPVRQGQVPGRLDRYQRGDEHPGLAARHA